MVVVLTIFVLGVIIFVHEFGHFLAAKLVGIYVETFSIGFGPRLFSFRFWNTDFLLSLVPFGGYVKMKGDNPEETTYAGDEFLGKPVPQRILVVISGPLMNLILGFVVFFAAYRFVGFTSIPGNRVEAVESGSIAENAGFMPGDRIVEVDGESFRYWDDFFKKILKPGTHSVTVLRGDKKVVLNVTFQDTLKLGLIPYIPPVIGQVRKGGPAERAGFMPGDSVVSINNIEIRSWNDMVRIIKFHPGDTLFITVFRRGSLLTLSVVPEVKKDENGKRIGLIGIMAPYITVKLPFVEAIQVAVNRTVSSARLIFDILGKLVTRKVSVKQIGGPVMIGKVIGESYSYGVYTLLVVVALISINLFVINIIPFPALDGWYILMFLIEGVARKPVPVRTQAFLQRVGFAILIAFMLLITFFDISRIFGGK